MCTLKVLYGTNTYYPVNCACNFSFQLHFSVECRKGYGIINAAGGMGWGGGGGGRISLDCYSIQEDLNITVHG